MNHLVCGNFQHQEEDDLPCPSPRKISKRKDNRENNPYASRGLDKFSTLLDELDQRRKKVYSQMNPHDISFVRFTYSKTDDFVPIVVKVKNHNQKKHKNDEEHKVKRFTSFSEPMEQKHKHKYVEETKQHKMELLSHHDCDKKEEKKIESFGLSWNMPSFYVPAVMILILLLLTVFGRSFATVCTCVVWYIVPILKDSSNDQGKSIKKKNIVVTEGKHRHQKSW
uniref:Uncharacterized protein LOC101509630 n=1 Tax=Cicer arietinum TaxID=3827 RepID=A0A1S2YA75_CICAR|nr:uncharacterized protein LOC101509630 [Cicer arietinum]